jgi:hypothetical protein
MSLQGTNTPMNPAHPVNKIMAAVRRLTDALDAAEEADLTVALNAVRPELDVLLRSIARADADYRRVTSSPSNAHPLLGARR